MSTTWIIIIAFAEIVWLWALLTHLKSEEIKATDKICWTVVLCVLNVVGLLLYIFAGPKVKEEFSSEEELKQALNEGRR